MMRLQYHFQIIVGLDVLCTYALRCSLVPISLDERSRTRAFT